MRQATPLIPIIVLFCLGLIASCTKTDNQTVDPASKLCNSGSGFGARIAGSNEPVEMCVADNATVTTFGDTGTNRYYIAADFNTASGEQIRIEISFVKQPLVPADLFMSANQSSAFGDPTAVWFHYSEIKLGEYEYVTATTTGDFRVSVNDDGIAAAWFSGILLDLMDENGVDVGSRTISEGFVSVIPDQ